MADSSSSDFSSAIGSLVGITLIVSIVFYALVIYGMWLFLKKLVNVISKHPKHPALWIPIASLVVFTLLTVTAREQAQLVCGCLALFSTIALVISTYAVDVYYDQKFPDDSKTIQATMNKLLGKNWWSNKQTHLLP